MPNRDGTGPDGLGPTTGRVVRTNGARFGCGIRRGYGKSLLTGECVTKDDLLRCKQYLEQQLEQIKQQLN